MSMIASPAHRLAHDEAGFTLIELLVAVACGIIVTGALFSILDTSLRQTSRITDRVQATQIGRTAMTNIVDELHSACLSRGYAPIKAPSTEGELRFATGFSEKSLIEYPEVFEHRILWSEGKLIDKTYKALNSAWPNFKFEEITPTSTVTLAQNISKQGATPIFQYYKYATTATTGGTETPSGALALTSPPKVSTEAAGIAAVQVTYSAAPSNNNTALNRSAELSSLVTLAFASPSSEATITDGPCQ